MYACFLFFLFLNEKLYYQGLGLLAKKNNVDFQSAYYPNKNHSISGINDNTSFHLWNKMTNWLYQNLSNENVKTGQAVQKAF